MQCLVRSGSAGRLWVQHGLITAVAREGQSVRFQWRSMWGMCGGGAVKLDWDQACSKGFMFFEWTSVPANKVRLVMCCPVMITRLSVLTVLASRCKLWSLNGTWPQTKTSPSQHEALLWPELKRTELMASVFQSYWFWMRACVRVCVCMNCLQAGSHKLLCVQHISWLITLLQVHESLVI